MLLSWSPCGVTRNKKVIVMADMVHKNDVLFQTALAEADDEEENFDLMF